AMQTPFTINLMTGLYRLACRSNHDAEIDVRDEQLETVAALTGRRPVVFLVTHKSMLDTAALSLVLFDADLPLPLTFGGINLNTPGIGALARRAGIIFLRRSFQDNETYKATFRRYIDYLIEKRFSLLWALEGTRSRTGKLLPPRFGLFNYVVGSILRTGLDNVAFVPVSVAYDQITEVEDYALEQGGRDKKPEGAGWMLRFFRRGKSHGRIFVRFGEALSVGDVAPGLTLTPTLAEDDKTALVQQLALRAAVAMNAATPITATAIITLILLAGGNRAQSLGEIQTLARAGAAMIRRRRLEIVGHSDFRKDDDVKATLAQLHATGIVSFLDEGIERLYAIRPDQHLKAAYYRNTAIHYFVLDALVEIALLEAAALDVGDQIEAFYATAERLRELFKFEFYFPRRAEFRGEIERRVGGRMRDWQAAIPRGETAMRAALQEVRPLLAHGVLRSFTDAYAIVAEMLAAKGDAGIDDDAAFIADCLRLGRQRLLQDRVFSAESVSKSLYATGLRLARYRGLDTAGCSSGRRDFVGELERLNGYLDDILHVTLSAARALRRH
ncbi:MAG: 1-acyl-sn-glycerol-3-phosphate acyltransferase, partial [Pseudomonadota bacterium]